MSDNRTLYPILTLPNTKGCWVGDPLQKENAIFVALPEGKWTIFEERYHNFLVGLQIITEKKLPSTNPKEWAEKIAMGEILGVDSFSGCIMMTTNLFAVDDVIVATQLKAKGYFATKEGIATITPWQQGFYPLLFTGDPSQGLRIDYNPNPDYPEENQKTTNEINP